MSLLIRNPFLSQVIVAEACESLPIIIERGTSTRISAAFPEQAHRPSALPIKQSAVYTCVEGGLRGFIWHGSHHCLSLLIPAQRRELEAPHVISLARYSNYMVKLC